MKKIIAIISFCAAVCACSLDREPLTGPSSATFPASEKEAQSGILAAYKSLANDIQQYEPWPSRWQDALTDIASTRTVLSNWPNYTKSAITASYSAVQTYYKRIYKLAGRVHLVLDKLDNIKPTLTDPDVYYQFKAEGLLLRALVYDRGCQVYGGIPFIDHCLTLEDNAYPRMGRDSVIARILKDLDDDLLDKLPVQWEYAKWGTCRFGRVGAYMLKARICLEWGYVDDAVKYSKKALDLAEGHYSLTPLNYNNLPATHADGEPDCTPLFGYAAETGSKEWILAVQYNRLAASNTHAGIYTNVSRCHNGAASWGPSMGMMDSFQMKNGKAITDEGSGYDWTQPWKDRDPRLELYCVRPQSRCMNVQFAPSTPSATTVMDYVLGEYVRNSDVAGNKSEYGPNGKSGPGTVCLWRKYTDKTYYSQITGTGYEDELDAPIMRYAELLLIDAEANIESETGNLVRAKEQINKIRARVGMPAITTTDRKELRKALRYERKIELCNEGFRWFDIRRWSDDGLMYKNGVYDSNKVPVAFKAIVGINATPVKMTTVEGVQYAPAYNSTTCNLKPIIDNSWIVTYDPARTFDGKASNARKHDVKNYNWGKDELWPFPQDELTSNPAMDPVKDQNPGYTGNN